MTVKPRIFVLNTAHELSPVRRGGGGGAAKLLVDWKNKGATLGKTLRAALAANVTAIDPSAAAHRFVMAWPEENLKYEGETNKQPAIKHKDVDFAGSESRLFRRLGFDLIGSADGGAAILHIAEHNRARIDNELDQFEEVGVKRRNDLAAIAAFAPIPMAARYSPAWFESESPAGSRVDVVVELMPVLHGNEVDEVIFALRKFLPTLDGGVRWKRIGRDFSRRAWLRLSLDRAALEPLLEAFPSIQRVHPPLYFEPAAAPRSATRTRSTAAPTSFPRRDVSRSPIVAIVDMGIPADHSQLSMAMPTQPHQRVLVNQYINPSGGMGARGDHGSKVASRVVFPQQIEIPATDIPPGPICRVVDINACDPEEDFIDGKAIVPMMQTAVAANPDVRVFNLSCRMRLPSLTTLAEIGGPRYEEALRATADLDNFAHRHDVLIVVACGNAPEGAVANPAYPKHAADPQWHLAAPAFAANALTVGSTVGTHISGDTVVAEEHRPSPFARVGISPVPGIKPDLSAVGGNERIDGVASPWMGVPVLDRRGEWLSDVGSSFAAPVVAREAAFLWRRLRDIGGGQVEPYAVTVKACLALSAQRKANTVGIEALAKVSLGHGYPEIDRWFEPSSDRAWLVWQGLLNGPSQRARVQFPIPTAWREAAKAPVLRLVWCWDPPVNPAVPDLWICRDISLQVRQSGDDKAAALHSPTRLAGNYPLRLREFPLSELRSKAGAIEPPVDDLWIIELGYSEIADPIDATLSSQQRVAIAAELVDLEGVESPQAALQAMPFTANMNQFSVLSPVTVKVNVP